MSHRGTAPEEDDGATARVDRDLFDDTIDLACAHAGQNANVTYVISGLLGPDTHVNESRVLAVQHLVSSWGARVHPVLVAATHAVGAASTPPDAVSPRAVSPRPAVDAAAERLTMSPLPKRTRSHEHAIPRPIDFPATTTFAIGRYNYTDVWYVVDEIRRRDREPCIRVKFLSRLDGNSDANVLPSPAIDWVWKITTTLPQNA